MRFEPIRGPFAALRAHAQLSANMLRVGSELTDQRAKMIVGVEVELVETFDDPLAEHGGIALDAAFHPPLRGDKGFEKSGLHYIRGSEADEKLMQALLIFSAVFVGENDGLGAIAMFDGVLAGPLLAFGGLGTAAELSVANVGLVLCFADFARLFGWVRHFKG